MLFILLSTLLALLVLVNYFTKDEEFERIPGPRGLWIVGHAFSFLMDPVKIFYYFRFLANEYKNIYKFNLGPKRFVILNDPDDIEILITKTQNNSKGYIYSYLKPWLRDGLLLSDGMKWHNRRKILTPGFHFENLLHFSSLLNKRSNKLVEHIEKELDKSKTALLPLVADFTLHSICETAMEMKLDEDASQLIIKYKQSIQELAQNLIYRIQKVWLHPNFIFALTSAAKKQKRILDLLSSFRDRVIGRKRADMSETVIGKNNICSMPGKKHLPLLHLLLEAEREGDINAEGIAEEVDTFIFEGHDTTATALQFALMLLANHQEIQDKVAEESHQILGTSTQTPTMEQMKQMKYLECCIKETLRLYPPVFFFGRCLTETTKLKSYEILAGTDVYIILYDLHRRNDQFPAALKFRPERFLTDNPTWHRFAYMPFSAGPRNCIGQKFAMVEMKLALSAVIRRYRVMPVTRPGDIIFITDFILRSNRDVYVKFVKR